MTPEVVLRALLEIWAELPALVGPDWPKIVADLEVLVDRLKTSRDPDVTTDIVLAVRPYPAARTRLQGAAAAISASDQQPAPSEGAAIDARPAPNTIPRP